MSVEPSQRVGLIRSVSGAALGLAVLWLIVDPSFEPIITALLGLAGLLSTRRDPERATTPGRDASSLITASSSELEMLPGGPKSVAVLPLKIIGGDAEKDEHLWSETYDRNLDDVFAIQSEMPSAHP